MIVDRLYLRDFGVFDGDHSWEFGDGITAITGDNGAGKTTLLEATGPGALFRLMPSRGKVASMATSSRTMLDLWFRHQGDDYRILHLMTPGRHVSASLYRNGQQVQTATLSDFDREIEALGFARETYLAGPYGGGGGGLAEATVAGRRSILADLLGLDWYDRVRETVRPMRDQARATWAELQAAAAARERSDGRQADIEATRAEIARLTDQLAEASRAAALGAVVRDSYARTANAAERRRRARTELLAAGAATGTPEAIKADVERARATTGAAIDAMSEARAALDRCLDQEASAAAAVEAADGLPPASLATCRGEELARWLDPERLLFEVVDCSACPLLVAADEAETRRDGLVAELHRARAASEAATQALQNARLRVEDARAAERAASDRVGGAWAERLCAEADAQLARAFEAAKQAEADLAAVSPGANAAGIRGALQAAQAKAEGLHHDEAVDQAIIAKAPQADSAKAKARARILSAIYDATARTGIQAALIEEAAPRLSTVATELVQSIAPAMSIELVTSVAKAGGRGERDTVTMDCRNVSGKARYFRELSSGEQALVGEAMRLAVVVHNAGGCETVWRDEADQRLSDRNADRFVELLRAAMVAAGFRRAMVISHRASVIEQCDRVIQL